MTGDLKSRLDRERWERHMAIREALNGGAVETSAPPLKPCPWCGRNPCPDRWEHDRLHAGSETTWRRARVAAAVLTPDDPALPGGTP